MKKCAEYVVVFFTGGVLYGICEIIWRGYTHISMVVLGGICLIGLYITQNKFCSLPLYMRCLSGCVFITSLELVTGSFVNSIMELNVWDYTDEAFNLYGQICLKYSAFWFVLCIPAFYICSFISSVFKRGFA